MIQYLIIEVVKGLISRDDESARGQVHRLTQVCCLDQIEEAGVGRVVGQHLEEVSHWRHQQLVHSVDCGAAHLRGASLSSEKG